MCIDPDDASKYVHVNKGDNLTLTAYYSIDPEDNRSFPIAGGNHTGIMNLFYHYIAEDVPEATYSCENNACVSSPGGVPLNVCQSACGPPASVGVPFV